jgi:hypothetical protein
LSWVEVFAVFVVCHLAGDFLLQTDWQATHKDRGLAGDPERRRALVSHASVYTLCFVPALVWVGLENSWGQAATGLILVYVPHLVQDDGRLLDLYIARVKGLAQKSPGLRIAVDQSFHILVLFGTALLVAS